MPKNSNKVEGRVLTKYIDIRPTVNKEHHRNKLKSFKKQIKQISTNQTRMDEILFQESR